mmetsp:Transcript_16767/g.31772  ORF Transcript_16767/g.31772 Transcript_16767/m.31772 type:complete len:380 (+) Transcript_16767:130-1269(+)
MYYLILFYQSVILTFYTSYTTVYSFSTKSSQSRPGLVITSLATNSAAISVYDNVLPKESCDILDELASKSGLSHKAFTRPLPSSSQDDSTTHTTTDSKQNIETTLDAILTELGDDSPFVEYWTRQEWRHIEAHADVDENLAKEQDAFITPYNMNDGEDIGSFSFRYPENGHVLYLKIGTNVQGPTCIFPNVQVGGDLVGKDPKSYENKRTEMVIVPAVDGRLLRFQGNALHAVPRPADLWLKSFVMGAPEHYPEEVWGRSVILFNTWKGEPPKNVPLDENNIMLDSLDSLETCQVEKKWVNQLNDWVKVTPMDRDGDCENVNNHEESSSESNVKIWLLGNERRRGYPMRTVKMKSATSISLLKDALFESETVFRVYLSS